MKQQQLDTLGLTKPLPESSKDSIGATTQRMSEDSALVVISVHPEKGHSANLEHQWGNACLWST